MAHCLELARHGLGHVSPNPLVGSILVDARDNVLGEGWHQKYGGPHAEQNAISNAEELHGSEALKDTTLYVNLEPCSHYGKTPPCAHLILEKGIPRVVIGMVDPFEKVSGRGIQLLRERGVEVCVGVLQARCERLNEAFSHHLATGKPLVHLKIAQTLDGRIATLTGDARWVSGKTSRTLMHEWRSEIDAILVGQGTALADDPALTVRHTEGRQPVRIVLDRTGRLPADLQLFSDAFAHKTIAVVSRKYSPAYSTKLEAAGGAVMCVKEKEGHLDLEDLLARLGASADRRCGIQSVLVEAGPSLATALFEQNLVDIFHLFIAPKILGQGKPTLEGLSITRMADAMTFAETRWMKVGEDMLFQGFRKKF